MNVNMLHNIYQKSLLENQKNIHFWEEYLRNLDALDLKAYSEKLTVPVLVPIGNRVLFRGQLKHTNEVTVALGADYFAKCSTHQAEVLKQRRINDAKSKLDLLMKEAEYLESHLLFCKQNLTEQAGHDIIEVFNEEEEMIWRHQHKEKVRQYKQKKDKSDKALGNEKTDEELWDRLEELELQEEMKNELSRDENMVTIDNKSALPQADCLDSDDDDEEDNGESDDKDNGKSDKNDDGVSDNKDNGAIEGGHETNDDDDGYIEENYHVRDNFEFSDNDDESDNDDGSDDDNNQNANAARHSREKIINKAEVADGQWDNEVYVVGKNFCREPLPRQCPKLELFNVVVASQTKVMGTLAQVVLNERARFRNEAELLERLDDLERIDDYEDEMNRLENYILKTNEKKSIDPNIQSEPKKFVTFADDKGNIVLQLYFTHSDVEPDNKPYDVEKGFIKPSDIREAFQNLNNHDVTPILKKVNNTAQQSADEMEVIELQNAFINRVVTEKLNRNDKKVGVNNERPTSLFRRSRLERKSRENIE